MNCPALAPPKQAQAPGPSKNWIRGLLFWDGDGSDWIWISLLTCPLPKALFHPSHLQLKSLVFFLSILTDTLCHSLTIVFDTLLAAILPFLIKFCRDSPSALPLISDAAQPRTRTNACIALYSHNPLYSGLFNRHLDFI